MTQRAPKGIALYAISKPPRGEMEVAVARLPLPMIARIDQLAMKHRITRAEQMRRLLVTSLEQRAEA